MTKSDAQEKLFRMERTKYGDKYEEHLLEQYKLFIESAEKISDRRQKANEFFFTLNSALITLFSFASIQGGNNLTFIIGLASLIAISVCYFWYRIIKSYKNMNTGKFKVIHAIEEKLPLALYDAEWIVLGKGEDPKLYLPFTDIEIKIPWVFIAFYLIIFLWNMPWTAISNFLCNFI